MKCVSWNIDSLNAALTSDSNRAQMSRDVLRQIIAYDPDIFAVQETKLSSKGPTAKHQGILEDKFACYDYIWVSSVEPARKGYAGTMVFYKKDLEVQATIPQIGAPAPMDQEGRIITLELEDVYFTHVYTPNAGSSLARLDERQVWDQQYKAYLQALDQEKPVIATGDFNVAHEAIDLAHPEANRRSAGFTDEERAGFSQLLEAGFTDTFRHLHGDVEGVYTWWAQRVKTSKINNSGWRIDYFLVSDRLADQVQVSHMMDSGPRQDHTPIYMEIDI